MVKDTKPVLKSRILIDFPTFPGNTDQELQKI